jgi:pimeloyl-ACP methyl ester carboxylesterase
MGAMNSGLAIREVFSAPVDGWALHLKRTISPAHLRPERRPLVIVPGYGMNAFIFGFHPRGTSMERCLAEAGFEVWSINLRRQGPSRRVGPRAGVPSLRAYAEADITAAIEAIGKHTETRADGRVVLLGCSLGGALAFAHLALVPDHRVAAVCAIGAPLRFVDLHPAIKLAFGSPRLVRQLRLAGTRHLARFALPLLSRAPWALGIYMNTAHVDLSKAAEMARTVDDPHPRVNSDIAKWIGAGDLVLGGKNVTEAMRSVEIPLQLVVSNRDGITPELAALSPLDVWGGKDIEVVRVGDDAEWFAHADLFIADSAPAKVFAPIARWAARVC